MMSQGSEAESEGVVSADGQIFHRKFNGETHYAWTYL